MRRERARLGLKLVKTRWLYSQASRTGRDDDEAEQDEQVLRRDGERVAEQEVFEAEVAAVRPGPCRSMAAEADGPGEEDADDRVAGQAGLLADEGDGQADQRCRSRP